MTTAISPAAIHLAKVLRENSQSFISPELFAWRFQISTRQLAKILQLDHDSLLRDPAQEKAQSYMVDAIHVVGLVLDVNGGDLSRAIHWYRSTPLIEIGGGTAEYHVGKGRMQSICSYIRNLSAGATG